MSTFIIVRPDGTVETDATVVAEFQETMRSQGTVVTLASPVARPHWSGPEPLVGYVFDWGRVDGLPINRKAWALYGRSTIHGPMLIGLDNRAPLSPEFVQMVSSSIEDWVPVEALAAIEAIAGAV